MSIVKLQHKASDRLVVYKIDPVSNSTRQHTDFVGADEESAHFCPDIESTALRDNQHITIGVIESSSLVHGAGRAVDVVSNPVLKRRITCSAEQLQTPNPVDTGPGVEGIPSKLIRDIVELWFQGLVTINGFER